MRLIDADAIQYDQLLKTGNKEHPLEWAVSQSSINSMPTIKAEPKHGRWMDYRRMGIDGTFHWFRCCSNYLYEREDDNEDKDTPYCPNCGAKMSADNATPHAECAVNLYTETKLRFVLDECVEDEELIEKILKALDEVEE